MFSGRIMTTTTMMMMMMMMMVMVIVMMVILTDKVKCYRFEKFNGVESEN